MARKGSQQVVRRSGHSEGSKQGTCKNRAIVITSML